jgi:hypothetical protein
MVGRFTLRLLGLLALTALFSVLGPFYPHLSLLGDASGLGLGSLWVEEALYAQSQGDKADPAQEATQGATQEATQGESQKATQ